MQRPPECGLSTAPGLNLATIWSSSFPVYVHLCVGGAEPRTQAKTFIFRFRVYAERDSGQWLLSEFLRVLFEVVMEYIFLPDLLFRLAHAPQ